MRYYTVHLPEGAGAGGSVAAGTALGDAVLVREGFNWLAFFFAPFWALAEGLWLAALVLIAALAALIAVPVALDLGPLLPAVLGLGYGLLAGFSGNDLRRAGLAGRGWRLIEIVAAPSRAQALIRYAEAIAPVPAPARAPQAATAARAPGSLDWGPGPDVWS